MFCNLARSFPYICKPTQIGPMAEWLGTALQKLLQRFESASDLQAKNPELALGVFSCPQCNTNESNCTAKKFVLTNRVKTHAIHIY